MKILIVDDSRTIHRIVARVVDMVGFEPAFAGNGVEALAALEKAPESFALVLMDWNMPEMDGLECLRAIRADERYAEVPVMMLTTESESSRVALALREGAANYCTKPFTPEGLARKIFQCLGQGDEA